MLSDTDIAAGYSVRLAIGDDEDVDKIYVEVPYEFKGCIQETDMKPIYTFTVDKDSSCELYNDIDENIRLNTNGYGNDFKFYTFNGESEPKHGTYLYSTARTKNSGWIC